MMFHAVPTEKYQTVPRARALAVKRELGVTPETRIIGTVTKLGPQRGNEYLLHAAAAALKIRPDLLFLLLYKPTYFHRLPSQKYVPVSGADIEGEARDLERLAASLGISRHVRFIELPANVDDWMAACDFIVAPFLSDRFSSVNLLEAMAQSKPVIATNIGEQREIVEHGIDGYLVAPGDVAELSQAILKILAAPDDLERMGRSARKKSEAYSVEAYARNLGRLYEELASKTARGRVGMLQEKSA
jgi:glycosyltransferase involved in cell wall biosynthesis